MDETSDNPGQGKASALLRTLRPAIPAVIGAAALTFLFAAVMPMSWVAGIAWNLYLDRLSDYFVPPVGNAARLILALGMAATASLIAGLVALLIAEPEAAGLSSLRARFRRESTVDADEDSDAFWTRRRRVDLHPDDPLRPPIRAGRDLPAGGLGPLNGDVAAADHSAEADPWLDEFAEPHAGELVLADLAPEDHVAGDEPWLQPAELTAKPLSAATADNSLGAMVARLEAGLARRREPTETADMAAPDGAAVEPDPEVDFALEAALSTLDRMTRQAVG